MRPFLANIIYTISISLQGLANGNVSPTSTHIFIGAFHLNDLFSYQQLIVISDKCDAHFE